MTGSIANLTSGALVELTQQQRHAKERSQSKCSRTEWSLIWSEDLNNLLPFYRDVLGLTIAYESPDFVGFGERRERGGYLGAYLGLGTHRNVKGKAAEPYRHMVGLDSSDVDTDFERLTAAGVEFIEPPTDYGGLRIAT
jgi:catechol 2,3-dioxygenase-like lactoylglutathione lyase family enzyme